MLQSGNIIKFKHLSNFKTKGEFDQHIYNFLQDHAKNFTKGELEAFKVLVQYSIKYKGVANARIAIFTKTSHENNNGYGFSRSTFERMLKKAVKLGILTIHSTNKVTKGGKGHNVYVFNRYDVQDIQEEVKEKKKPSKLDKIKMLANAIKRGDDRPFKKKLKYVNSDKLKQCKSDQTPCDSKQEQSQTEKEAIRSPRLGGAGGSLRSDRQCVGRCYRLGIYRWQRQRGGGPGRRAHPGRLGTPHRHHQPGHGH